MDRQKWRLWAERVWRFEQSGLTGAEWCRREGLPLEQFYLWRRMLQAHGVVPAEPEGAAAKGVGSRYRAGSLTGTAHGNGPASRSALAGRNGPRSERSAVNSRRHADVAGAGRPQETGSRPNAGRRHGQRGSKHVAMAGAIDCSPGQSAELLPSPVDALLSEPAAVRQEPHGHTRLSSSARRSSRHLGAPDLETFLPVELLQPQWVERILTNGVQIRVPAADERIVRTVIETAGSLLAVAGEPRTSATVLATGEGC